MRVGRAIASAMGPAVGGAKGRLRLGAARVRWASQGVRLGRGVSLVDVDLGPFVNIAHDAELARATVGKRTSVGRYTKVHDAVIGKYCSISWDVTIGAIAHPMDHLSCHAFWYRKQFGIVDSDAQLPHKKAVVGNDVWVGCDAVIMPGVVVGDGAVVGANSVVTKDVEPYAIVVGSPARKIGSRFEGALAGQIRDLRWWDWSDEKISENLAMFEAPISQFPSQLL